MEQLVNNDLDLIVRESLSRSLSPQVYKLLMNEYAKDGKTTGPTQKEDLIYYTKLNAQRSKRIAKTFVFDEKLVRETLKINQPQTWILLTESWCGDAANSVPVISKLAQLNAQIDLKLILRDENLELMDQFPTNGGRSIPKLIVLNGGQVQHTWGPRPKEAQRMYNHWKNAKDKVPHKEFHVELQKWYNADKGQSIQAELLSLVSR